MRLGALVLLVVGLLQSCGVGVDAGSGEEIQTATHESESTHAEGGGTEKRVIVLNEGEFVTFAPDEVRPGDVIVCRIAGKEVETVVPPADTGVSRDPMYVQTKTDGTVRAECGGIHAETAPPGSW